MGIVWVRIFRVGIVQVEVILGGNFPRWEFSGWELSDGNHPDGNFLDGSFSSTDETITISVEQYSGKKFSQIYLEVNAFNEIY